MIKNGLYCIFNGKEYKFNRSMNGDLLIITDDKSKIDGTFIDKYNNGTYSKKVNKIELKEIYKIKTIGEIKGLCVNVEKELESTYLVGTNNLEIAEKLGLKRVDKYYHEGEILKENIVVIEEKSKVS